MLLTEFSEAQKKALELYLEVDEEYRPPSFTHIAKKLNELGYVGSSSSVQRWSKICDFESYLNRHVNALVLADKEDYKKLEKEAGAENLKKTLMTLEENAELLHGSHGVLKLLVEQIEARAKSGKAISKDDAKLMIQLYNITSTREDRLHDRQAGLDAVDKITKADLLKKFASTGIEFESSQESQSDEEFTDVEIES